MVLFIVTDINLGPERKKGREQFLQPKSVPPDRSSGPKMSQSNHSYPKRRKEKDWIPSPNFPLPRDWTHPPTPHITGRFFTISATREVHEYWNESPLPSLGALPDPGIELGSPALPADSLPVELLRTQVTNENSSEHEGWF